MNISPPLGLVAELTHQCPLACLYCSNPLELTERSEELSTDEWQDVLRSARDLGVVQLHLTGGEPLLRRDLEQISTCAAALGFYTNLITSGIGLTKSRTEDLANSGINNVQLSLQSDENDTASAICGRASVESKMQAARYIVECDLPLCWNIVLHKMNIGRIKEMVDLCASFRPHRIELAHVQFHGRALLAREKLLPSRSMIELAETELQAIRRQYQHEIEILYVRPDWFQQFPKPCNGGWAKLQMTITPSGVVLPCTSAGSIAQLNFDNVRTRDLRSIWYESDSFNAFRGVDWMPEPCFSCERRLLDFGGCRCQSFALTGDAARTDPACSLSPDRNRLNDIMATTLQ